MECTYFMVVAAVVFPIQELLETMAPKLAQECGEAVVSKISIQDFLLFELVWYEDTKRTPMRLPCDKVGILWFRENMVEFLHKSHVFNFSWQFVADVGCN